MKTIFQSKVFWVNLIMAVLSVCAVISPEFLTTLGLNSTKALSIIATVTAVLNIILRLITSSAIVTKKELNA